MAGHTLATIHNVHFLVDLVDRMRTALESGDFEAFRVEFLGRYYARRARAGRERAEGRDGATSGSAPRSA